MPGKSSDSGPPVWRSCDDDSADVARHELQDQYDVVIIGGGVHGLATAYYLTQLGVRNIAVLEAKYVGFGGSGRNTAIVRSNYRTPEGSRSTTCRSSCTSNWRRTSNSM